MSKIIMLIKNEFIKAIKKTSTKIMIILAVLALFLAVGISKLIEFETNYFEGEMIGQTSWKEEVNTKIQSSKQQLEKENSNREKAELQATIETYELALESNIDIIYSSNWKTACIEDIQISKSELYQLEKGTEEYNTKKNEIDEKIKALKEEDYNSYMINSQIKTLEENLKNKEITQQEYNDALEIKELQKKYEIGKDDSQENQWKQSIISELTTIKESLRTGIDSNTGKVLNYETQDKLKETEKIDLYRLEHNVPTVDTMSNFRSFYDYMSASMAMFFVGILAIILAGSAISSEISKGTIKFWIMTPNKRWKILLSKLLNIVIMIVCLTIVLSLVSTIIGGIFFKEEPQPYLYVQNGEVHELNPMVYKVLNYLTYDIDILVYTVLALMLSTLIRNTALAIGVTVASYAGSGMIMEILNMFVKADWLKFVPFNNMNLTDKIFSNSVSYMSTMDAAGFSNNVSVGFSLAVLGVTTVLMLITMFDSFNKRDIV